MIQPDSSYANPYEKEIDQLQQNIKTLQSLLASKDAELASAFGVIGEMKKDEIRMQFALTSKAAEIEELKKWKSEWDKTTVGMVFENHLKLEHRLKDAEEVGNTYAISGLYVGNEAWMNYQAKYLSTKGASVPEALKDGK